MNESYRAAGVDVTAGYRAVELMKQHVKRTQIPGVLSDIGGFGGLFELPAGMLQPVLVSGTDGVGTKLKLAFLMDKHDTVGQDCVAMCVNDIACSGAQPLFFLDYIALCKNVPEQVAEIVKGVAEGCCQAGCALIGGETAEMPGFYTEGEYDLAGFSVGVVEKDQILEGSRLQAGDALIGVASSGVHSNGFSLVRKIFGIGEGTSCPALARRYDELSVTLGEALLEPTRIYVKAVRALMESCDVKAISHITGGGFIENVPRMMKDGLTAVIRKDSYVIPPIFDIIAREGKVPEQDLYNTFNMGIGLIVAVAPQDADRALAVLEGCGENAWIIGEVASGTDGVSII